ncbi:MAG: glycosyltransferase family 4 protein [Planctomycetota bacterium]|jgi:glycosyltransferase involved in cell wall biosynthesis
MTDSSLNILFLSGPLVPRSTTSHSLYLARKIQDLGPRVVVATPGGPLESEYARWDVTCYVEPRLTLPFMVRSGVSRLHRALDHDGFAPDLLHVQSPEVDRLGTAVARNALPLFISIHTALRRRQPLRLPPDLLRGIVAGSQEIRENLVNHRRIRRDLIRVISTGVDANYFRPDGRVRDPRRPFIPVVGMVGRFETHKGAHIFVQAAKIVVDQGHDVHFLLSGSGPENEHLRERVKETGLEGRVTFAPESRDYRSLLGAIDILVRPATREGLSISPLEAMACGKPVIATGVGTMFGIVKDGETGYLVPRGDVSSLALAITRLVTNPAKAMDMGRRARKLVEEAYDIAEKAKAMVEFYREKIDGV